MERGEYSVDIFKLGDKILALLQMVFGFWNNQVGLVFSMLGQSPVNFKGGGPWQIIEGIEPVFVGVGASLVVLFFVIDFILLASGGEKIYKKNWQYIVKYMATIGITLTFLIYLTLLAPTSELGFVNVYLHNGAGSLCVHFIAPVFAILDFLWFDYRYKSTLTHVIFAVIPPLVYVGFVVLAAELGLRWNETMWAPYNFLNFGAPTGWFGFDAETLGIGVFYMIVVLLFIFLGIGQIYLVLKNRKQKRMRAKSRNR